MGLDGVISMSGEDSLFQLCAQPAPDDPQDVENVTYSHPDENTVRYHPRTTTSVALKFGLEVEFKL